MHFMITNFINVERDDDYRPNSLRNHKDIVTESTLLTGAKIRLTNRRSH